MLDAKYNANQKILFCSGDWSILNLDVQFQSKIQSYQAQQILTIDGTELTKLDSAGAELLMSLLSTHPDAKILLNDSQQKLMSLIQSYATQSTQVIKPAKMSWLATFGKSCCIGYRELLQYLAFVGEIVCLLGGWLLKPQKILGRNIARVLQTSGYMGMPIIGLLSFLVGVVLAYQMGTQLENYGANIFVVNLLGISILREFAPLMTAIIVAGRTGAAFTAELGTMKVNQELDALMTMGVKPVEYLVLPKIIGLVIALPLLSLWASFAGVLGGMIMAKVMLGITFSVFMHQFQTAVAMKQLWIGLMKAPVFAFIIASIGCFQGVQVSGGAESVGLQTTRSVVQSLFLIIVADAFFSIILSLFHA